MSIPLSAAAAGHHDGRKDYTDMPLHAEDFALLSRLSPRKRQEWLASRDLLYRIAGLSPQVRCMYDDFGKPYLEGIPRHISVSHSGRWCAAMISDQPCGIDIQEYSDTVHRIRERFLTSAEIQQAERASRPLHHLHLLWGAKECMYKAYGKRNLGFREHIHISFLDIEAGCGHGEIRYENLLLPYDLFFRMLPEAAWVGCLEHPVQFHHDHHRMPVT